MQPQQRTSPQPTSQQPRHSHHDATFDTFPTTIFATTHHTNAVLHGPRGDDLAGRVKEAGLLQQRLLRGPGRTSPVCFSRLFPPALGFPPNFPAHGMWEVRSEPGVKGHVKEGPRFGGIISLALSQNGLPPPLAQAGWRESERGGARNGAERRAEPRLTKGEHKAARGLVLSCLVLPGLLRHFGRA